MPRKSKFTRENLAPVVAASRSKAELLRKLGYQPSGGMHRHISKLIDKFQIPTDHFVGRGWSRGLTHETSEGVAKVRSRNRIPDEEVFVENSTYQSGRLYRRLVKLGWKEECRVCGVFTWQGKPLRLHVDHINGVCSDHRVENLQFLCPNCHSQTPTYSNKKRK